MRKIAPDRRADLRYFLRRAEPVEARHQRGVQACRYRRGRSGRNRAFSRALRISLQNRFGHLLDEQRDAVSALDDVLSDARRKGLVADDAINQRARFARCKPIDGESGHIRAPQPRRLEFGTIGHDKQHTERWYSVHDVAE
jgi:hypothetical protein